MKRKKILLVYPQASGIPGPFDTYLPEVGDIIKTRGVMSAKEARKKGVGGEVLVEVW